MVDYLQRKGISDYVFAPVYSSENHIVPPKEYVDVAVCFKKKDRVLYHLKQKKILKRILGVSQVSKFNYIHAYTVFTDGNVARNLFLKYGIPYVVAVRNTDVNTFFRFMVHLRPMGLRVLLDAKYICFLSEAYRNKVIVSYTPKKLRKKLLEKSIVIPNGIDSFWLENKNTKRDIPKIEERLKHKYLNLLYVGVIDKNKNTIATCKAIERMEKEGWKISFTVVGKIKDNAVYEKIKKHIEYFEPMGKESLIEKYRQSDIFIMPSFKETFGLVYAEAMSQGLPVIYSIGQGFDTQFQEGQVGYHVDPKSIDNIVDAIKQVVANYKKISETCVVNSNKYSWDAITDKYIELYLN